MDDRERFDRFVIGATLLILDSLVLWFLWTRDWGLDPIVWPSFMCIVFGLGVLGYIFGSARRPPPVHQPGAALEDLAAQLVVEGTGRLAPRETSSVEGLLRGERVSARVSAAGSGALWRLVARVELSVPFSAKATIVRGPTGPCAAGFRPLSDPYAKAEGEALLRVVLGLCDEVDVGERGVEARSRDELAGPAIVLLVRGLIDLAAFVRANTQADDALVRPRGLLKCPFCLDEVDPKVDDSVACPRCATLHHGECWTENRGRCTVRGCEPERAGRVPEL